MKKGNPASGPDHENALSSPNTPERLSPPEAATEKLRSAGHRLAVRQAREDFLRHRSQFERAHAAIPPKLVGAAVGTVVGLGIGTALILAFSPESGMLRVITILATVGISFWLGVKLSK
ncbi:MAG: hypothetical protein AAGI38_02890 [Bacteroidota bacterium]